MKKILAAVITIIIPVFLFYGISYAEGTNLKDIEKSWAKADILKAVSEGYVKGYSDSTFRPDSSVTRAEFITMLNSAFSVPTSTAASNFKDVKNGDWYTGEIMTAVNAGYVSGYPDNTFKPDKSVNREESAYIINNLAKLSAGDQKNYKDSNKISGWAKPSIDALAANGIMSGYPDGSFCPSKSLTRAEAVVIINKVKALEASTPQKDNEDITPVHTVLTVTGSKVNLRSGPGTSYGIVGKVYKGDILTATQHSAGNWYNVTINNLSGWITGDYVKETTDINRGDSGQDNTGRGNPGTGTDTDSNTGSNNGSNTSGNEVSGSGKLVVIDPGHGGYDPGALGTDGTYEKDINLAIALKLSDYLTGKGYRVLLTRSDDTFVPLIDRSNMANNAKADIFVSIHCNSLNHKTSGTTTFTEPLSGHPVYSPQEDSKRLATYVQSQLTAALGLPDRGVSEEGLSVCRETNAPAILVETAFIDNPADEKMLIDPLVQEASAQAIGQGIDLYFANSQPESEN
ncbi:MAG: N-acetylmuramoyl-L-alanine amidase [Bacillota bacterium]|nr:N-acetylmuramoyl-L-alanine amidase [Bacillota bacterium]